MSVPLARVGLCRPPPEKKLMLIDGHSIAYRAFFALPVENFSTVTGQHTNGVFGFTSMLINVLRDEAPTHLGVAFDVSRRTFRSEIYPEYKANRSTTPDEFRGQLDLVKEVLKALNIPFVEKEGFEADDVIGTLATQAEAQGYEVLICTGDRDAFQLVSENVTVLYPRKGVSDLGRMTPAAVRGAVLRHPRPLPGPGGAGRGVQRQPARGAGRRAEDGGQVAGDLRRAGEPGGSRRGAEGQGGRGVPGAGRRRAAQPAGQRPGPRPRPAAETRRPGAPAVEPGGHPSAVRRAGVPGAPRPAARSAAERGGDRARGRLRPERRHPRTG